MSSVAVIELNYKNGFTLIELIIVIAIIGILAAIAVPQYTAAYRQRACDRAALAQIRDVATAEESHFAANGSYTTDLTVLKSYGFKQDPEVTRTRSLVDKTGTLSDTAFQLTAKHNFGTDKIYLWMSDNGGLQ